MKVLVNGGLNISELDGWWAEAYAPEVGWAIGDGREHGDDPAWDAAEAEALYILLERQVVPEFYCSRDGAGIPTAWVARIRESMARLTPEFSANRVVREYAERHYLPAAAAYRRRAAKSGAEGRQIVEWRRDLEQAWPSARFGRMTVKTTGGQHRFEVELLPGSLNPDAVQVEIFADAVEGHDMFRKPMTRRPPIPDSGNGFNYNVTVPATRPASDYTPRLVPCRPGALVPLEADCILWQR
jgi:starch phosphorylase